MALTTAQYVALKADILLDPILAAQPMNSDGAFAIAAAYNLTAVPQWVVWRTEIPTSEVKKKVVWTELIGRSAGERDVFLRGMLANGIIDASDINNRQGINDCFSGPSGVTTRTQLTELAKRDATRIQKLFSTGAGTTLSPATGAYGDFFMLQYQDVEEARKLP